MSTANQSDQVMVGDDVYGSDGDKVGTVADVQPDYLLVEQGFFFPTDYYIPLSAVASASAGRVSLHVTKDVALQSGWDSAPEFVSTTATEPPDAEDDVLGDRALVAGGPAVTGDEIAAGDDLMIPVREEELTATVRQQDAGAVRIEKRVVAEDRELEVPVTDEQIRVERRVVDRAVDAADAGAFEEIVIEVPLTSETAELQKQARVTEEVVVRKEAVERTERVAGTVRREEVVVDGEDVSDRTLGEGSEKE